MMHKYPLQHFVLALAISLFLMSCGDKDDDSASNIHAEPCNYLTEALVKSAYGLSDDFEIENKPIYGSIPICSYGWEIGTGTYSVSLNFSPSGKVSNDQAERDWESQNETVYKEYEIEEVNNVGERATWTTLGHGQLRVLYKGYLFYVNASYVVLEPQENSPFPKPVTRDHELMKERAITIAKAIVNKL